MKKLIRILQFNMVSIGKSGGQNYGFPAAAGRKPSAMRAEFSSDSGLSRASGVVRDWVYAARSAPELSRGQRQWPATGQSHREGKNAAAFFRLMMAAAAVVGLKLGVVHAGEGGAYNEKNAVKALNFKGENVLTLEKAQYRTGFQTMTADKYGDCWWDVPCVTDPPDVSPPQCSPNNPPPPPAPDPGGGGGGN